MIRHVARPVGCAALCLLATGCMSLDYDLTEVPVPVHARPAAYAATHFQAQEKHVLWAHGLLGESRPDVADLVTRASEGADAVAGFRVTHAAGFHDWLLTHLTLTLVRMKTVTIEGQLVGPR